MDIGSTLHKIRKDKGLTLKEVAGEVISVSHLSRVEKGENKLSTDEFFLVLENLNTTVEEFQFIRGNDRESYQKEILEEIVEAMNHRDIKKLKDIEGELKQKSYAPYSFEQFMLIGIENVYSGFNQKAFDGSFFLDYLMQVENWGKLELNIFMLFAITLPSETIVNLMDTAIKKCQFYGKLRGHELMPLHLLQNVFTTFLFLGEIKHAEMILHRVETDYLLKNDSIQEHLGWEFNKGLLHFKKGEIEKGKRCCERTIQLSERLGKEDRANNFRRRLEQWLKRTGTKEYREIHLEVEWF